MPVSKKTCVKKSKRSPKSLISKKSNVCRKTGVCYNNFVRKMGVYFINCKMHEDRYKKFNKYAKKAKLKACKIPCVLGKKLNNDLICEMVSQKMLSKSADMTAIEVSINLSHYNAWMRIANSCLDYGLIMEDDVEVHKDFIEEVNTILEALEEEDIDFSILHLWDGNWMRTRSKCKKVLKINKKLEIIKQTINYNSGAVGYIISKDYAKFLLKKSFPIRDPNDILMGKYVKRGNHLTLKCKYDKKEGCYKSPILDNPCGGPEGTGITTRGGVDIPTIKEISCRKCK